MPTDHPVNASDRPRRSGLLRAGGIVGAMTLISRIMGFIRDQVLAILFGASTATDVFLVAWKIPNFMRKLFAEGAFAQSFIPVFAEYRETGDRQRLQELAAHTAGTLSIIMLVITTIGVMAAPLLIMIFAPGYLDSPARYELAVHMLRITFPYLFFVSLLAYAGSILNTFGRFAIPSFTPVLLNVSMIVAALYFSPWFDQPIKALAWGVLAAGMIQLLFQIPFLQQIGMLPRPRWGWRHSGVRRVLKLMGPVIFGSSVAQISSLLDTVIASFLITGSISWLYYSDRLVQFPLGVLGVALATVILPRLSSEHTNRLDANYRNTLTWALRVTLVIGLPAAAGLWLTAELLLSTLFEYGAFDAKDTLMASWSLRAYCLGLPAYLLIKVLLPAFFARQNTRTPVRIGVIALASNMALNLILVISMVRSGFFAPHVGLAIASSITAWQHALMLYWKLRQQDIYRITPALWQYLLKCLPALLIMCLAVMLLLPENPGSLGTSVRVGYLTGIMLIALLGYALGLFVAGIRVKDFRSDKISA